MYSVEVNNKGTTIFKVKARENGMEVEPLGKGFSPAEVLLASLGSCVGYFVKRYIETAKLGITDFSVKLESDFVREKKMTLLGMRERPLSMRKIKVRIDLKGAQIDPQRKEALLKFVMHCPIKATLEEPPEIDLALL
ncbi:MAG: OsmC family protein [Deltaproteobacteria bacterium]